MAMALHLTDAALITCARTHLKKLELPTSIHGLIEEQLITIASSALFSAPNFSLFTYSAHASPSTEKICNLRVLWRVALQGAAWVIKNHDLRERPMRYTKDAQMTELTPPDISEIAAYFEAAGEFERVLYGSDPWYRDHFAHVLRVWLLGLYVIFECKNEKLIAPRVTTDSEINASLFAQAEIYAAFTIAALTHDLGYPIQKVSKLNDALDRILKSSGGMEWQTTTVKFSLARHEIAQQLLRLIAAKPIFIEYRSGEPVEASILATHITNRIRAYRDNMKRPGDLVNIYENCRPPWGAVFRTQWKYHQKYADSLENVHHGLLSALLLQRKMLFFKEGEFAMEEDYRFSLEEARQFTIRRDILRAMADHTCPDIYIWDILSIGSLLFFCDEIQEWGRPFFSDLYSGKLDTDTRVVLQDFTRSSVSWEVQVGELHVGAAARWLLSAGRNLYRRLRSAPETWNEMHVSFLLRWKVDNLDFNGRCLFQRGQDASTDLQPFRLYVWKGVDSSSEIDISQFVEDAGSGHNEKDLLKRIEGALMKLR